MNKNRKQPTSGDGGETLKKTVGKKTYETMLWLGGIACWIFVFYLLIGAIHKKHSLDKNRVRSKAIVDDFFSIRYTDFFGYHFWVDGKEYQGSGWYYPESDTLSMGDTVIIYYDSTTPDNNKLEREYTW